MTETLKLLFNIAYFYPSKRTFFSKSIASILKILTHRPIHSPPLQQPINHLINGLTYLDLEDRRAYAGLAALRLDVPKAVEKLIALLDAALCAHATKPTEQPDGALLPLVGILKRLAAAGLSDVRPLLRESLLMRRAPSRSSSTTSSLLRRDKSKTEAQLLPALLQGFLTSAIPTVLHDALSALVLEVADGAPLPSGWNVSSRLSAYPAAGPRESSFGNGGSGRKSAQFQPLLGERTPSAATSSGGSGGSDTENDGAGCDRRSSASAPSLFDSRGASPVAEIVGCGSSSSEDSSLWCLEGAGRSTLGSEGGSHGENSTSCLVAVAC